MWKIPTFGSLALRWPYKHIFGFSNIRLIIYLVVLQRSRHKNIKVIASERIWVHFSNTAAIMSVNMWKLSKNKQTNSLQKVSLSWRSLCHLPARGQGHVVWDLIGGLAEMLWGGPCWGHAHGARSPSAQLKGGGGGVCPDVLRSERTCCPCIRTCLHTQTKRGEEWEGSG